MNSVRKTISSVNVNKDFAVKILTYFSPMFRFQGHRNGTLG